MIMEKAPRSEYIVCSAIYYQDGIKRPHQPSNIKTGIVVAGLRHHNCLITLYSLLGDNYDVRKCGPDNQGFITNKDRFVHRKEALTIATKRNQLICTPHNPRIGLFSEDIF
jgi:hypothetical protein